MPAGTDGGDAAARLAESDKKLVEQAHKPLNGPRVAHDGRVRGGVMWKQKRVSCEEEEGKCRFCTG